MWKIQKSHVNIAIVIHAVLNMGVKWLGGVLIGKLLSTSLNSGQSFGDLSPLYRIVLLDDLSFEGTAVLATIVIVLNTLAVAMERSLAVLRATERGRSLRRQVLGRATCCGAASAESDIGYTASELVRRISLIEDFQRHEESLVLYEYLVLSLSVTLVFCIWWYAGLLVVLVLGVKS